MLEWFKAVFEGRKLPSRNEFAVDYAKYVRTLVKEGRISIASEEEMLTNGREKIIYELNNMFASVNKMTYGRPHSFCPVLTESNLLKSPKQLLKLQMSPMKPSRLPMSKKPKLSSMPTKRLRPPKRLLKKNASAPMVATNSFRRGVLVSNMV